MYPSDDRLHVTIAEMWDTKDPTEIHVAVILSQGRRVLIVPFDDRARSIAQTTSCCFSSRYETKRRVSPKGGVRRVFPSNFGVFFFSAPEKHNLIHLDCTKYTVPTSIIILTVTPMPFGCGSTWQYIMMPT